MDNKLIFSTKGLYTSTNIIIYIIIYIVACIFLFVQFPYANETLVGSVISFFIMFLFATPFVRSLQTKKSYVELYNDHIIGFTVPQSFFATNNGSACDFQLKYSDIINVDTQPNMVKIYFNGGFYLVQATGVAEKVAEIIRSRKAQI